MARVTEIRYVGYAVPELAAEERFYLEKWGLRKVESADGMVYLATESHDELYVVRLRQAPEKRIDVISLAAASPEDVDSLYDQVNGAGCRIITAPASLQQFGSGYGFRFFSPDGLSFEISADVARGKCRTLAADESIPERISHIVLHSPDPRAATQFFIDVLGFRLSDWLGDFMSFLRCNEWHHRIAFLPGPPCLNHVAYDMNSLDAMMRGIARLKQQDVEIKWGPGRHTAGNNTFSYFVTPSGYTVEYTAELERIDESIWQSHVYPPSAELMDRWGIGTGGPFALPEAVPDPGLFKATDA